MVRMRERDTAGLRELGHLGETLSLEALGEGANRIDVGLIKVLRAELEHLYEAIIDGRADAVLMASVTHFGNYTIRQMKEYLADRGIAVNL